ncbi:hypothetical protein C9J03_00825 [Photobacterium gaetbulicola]|uniref:Putative RND efflux transporter n=1 Tax=Photobacterium gaetbulicola Gung47 TaxID=658445 RepID=A0A0C5WRU3_9GAMM|nr:MMPL family transporter [Photobacterium gaetbulicola]AJR05685.1 putative RND efflux transporter [Photobacterium gaetbulicola Gung47]PSU14659.1 hypothetical protein C9J03_00825 [Photobacterium gaetbulicola]
MDDYDMLLVSKTNIPILSYCNWLLRNRLIVFTLVMLVTCFFGYFLKDLRFDSNYRIWFSENDTYLQSYDNFITEFGNDDMFVVAFNDPNGVINEKPIQTIVRLTDQFWKMTDVIRVDSLTNYQGIYANNHDIHVDALFPDIYSVNAKNLKRASDYVETDALLMGSLITADKTTAILRVKFSPNANREVLPVVIFEELTKILQIETERSGYEFYMAGGPITDAAFDQLAQKDGATLNPILWTTLLVALFLLFRNIWAVLVPFIVACFAIVITLGITSMLGFKLNTMTVSLPQFIMAIAVAGSLHIISGFLFKKSTSASTADAVRYTVLKNFKPIMLTSITTAIGFFSFIFASVEPIKTVGLMAGFGTLVLSVLFLTLMPIILSLYPKKPSKRLTKANYLNGQGFVRLSKWINYRQKGVLTLGAVAALIAAICVPSIKIDTLTSEYFSDNYWFKQAINFIEKEGSGAAVFEILIHSEKPGDVATKQYMDQLSYFTDYLTEEAPGGFTSVYSLSTIIKNINRAMNQNDPTYHVIPEDDQTIAQYLFLYSLSVPVGMDINDRINISESSSRITVIRPLLSTNQSRLDMKEIHDWVENNLTGIDIEFTGRDVLYTNMGNNIAMTFVKSLGVALVGITLLIAVMYRSVKYAILSLIPNVFPLVVVVAVMVIFEVRLNVGTVMVASLALGIAVDDTIHFLNHYLASKKAAFTTQESIENTLKLIGYPIFSTTAVLILSFLTFILANFNPNLYFGLLLSVGIFVAFISDAFLLPAVLLRFDNNEEYETHEKGELLTEQSC